VQYAVPDSTKAHGLGSSNNFYTPIIPSLTKAGYTCIAYDLTGSALSTYTYIHQTIQSLAADAIDLMDALSIPTATFLGHSMSGMTGPVLAATYPDRVNALVLIGPVYPSEAVTPVFEDRIAKVSNHGMEVMADTVPFAALGSKAVDVHRAFVRELVLGMQPAAYISLCRVVAEAWKDPPRYEDVKCPVVILAGNEDKSAPVEGCEKILGELGSKRKEIKTMQGVGHWHCIEDGAEVARLTKEFLASVHSEIVSR